jgi:hypothetical protein
MPRFARDAQSGTCTADAGFWDLVERRCCDARLARADRSDRQNIADNLPNGRCKGALGAGIRGGITAIRRLRHDERLQCAVFGEDVPHHVGDVCAVDARSEALEDQLHGVTDPRIALREAELTLAETVV